MSDMADQRHISGAAMDRRVAVPRRYGAIVLAVVVLVAIAGLLLRWWPRGVPVSRADVEIAAAEGLGEVLELEHVQSS